MGQTKAVLAKSAAVCLLVALALSFATDARADVVSGQVYGPDGNLLPNQTFRVLGEHDKLVTTFKTDGSGYFSVYLEPAAYRVRPEGRDDSEGTLSSYPQPVRQDVRLRRR